MRIFVVILSFLFATNAFAAIQLTQEQYDLIGVIDQEMRVLQPTFTGFNGSRTNMKVYGISDATALSEIAGMNLNQLKNNDPKRKAKKKIRNKLKAVGLDDDDLRLLGLENDIPDA